MEKQVIMNPQKKKKKEVYVFHTQKKGKRSSFFLCV